MSLSKKSRACEECGAELSTELTQGLCPHCLLGATIGAATTDVPPANSPSILPVKTLPGMGNLPVQLTAVREGCAKQSHLFGNYELLEQIASGGMGIVYKARQLSLNRIVAIKTLPFGGFTRDTVVKRFRAEAEAAARLRHPNIVAIHEVGEYQGAPYFSMDYVEGPSLAELIREQPLETARAARFVRTVAEAVTYAHGKGILHRDLKPSNILIDALDQPHITDFGLAKDLKSDSELTLTGQTLGSPNYIPREQIDGRRGTAGPHSDVYSLGAVLYHLLTGRPPFVGDSLTTTLQQVATIDPVAPRLLNPTIPRDLETICLKCLEKEPDKRYGGAQQLADELGRWQADEPILARPAGRIERATRWCRRRPARASGLATIALLILGLAVGGTALHFRTREARFARELARSQAVHSQLENVRALRRSTEAGRRFAALEALAKVRALSPIETERDELRDEAIAALVLPDIRPKKTWDMGSPRVDGLVQFSRNQDIYARPALTNSVIVRKVHDDSEVALLRGHDFPTRWIEPFSPDGRFLAVHDDPQAFFIWDIQRQEIVFRIPIEAGFAFTPDSRYLVMSRPDNSLSVVSLSTLKEMHRLQLDRHFAHFIFAADGEWFLGLARDSDTIDRRRTSTGKLLDRFVGPTELSYLALSHDQTKVAAGTGRGQVIVWNLLSGKQQFMVQLHHNLITSIVFNHGSDWIATTSWDGTFRLCDAQTGELLLSEDGQSYQLEFSADDTQLAYIGGPEQFTLLEVAPRSVLRTLHTPIDRPGSWSLAFSADGHTLAVGELPGVRFWNIQTEREISFLPLPEPRSVIFSPDGKNLMTSGDRGLLRWDLRSGDMNSLVAVPESSQVLCPGEGFVHASASSDFTKVMVANADHQGATFLDLSGRGKPLTLGPHRQVHFVALHPSGSVGATATWGGSDVKVWSTETGLLITNLSMRGSVYVSFSPDGQWLATSGEDVRLYQTGEWRLAHRLELKRLNPGPKMIAFSQDGYLFAVANRPYDIELFNPRSGRRVAALIHPLPTSFSALAFSPDSRLLAGVQWDANVQVWNLQQLHNELAKLGLDW